MKFRKKPIVIEAVQWFEGTAIEGVISDPAKLVGVPGASMAHQMMIREGGCIVPTLEGLMCASPGDWIITGIKGERYPCKDEIFKATYEAVELAPESAGG